MDKVKCRVDGCDAMVSVTADVCPECGASDPAGTLQHPKSEWSKFVIGFLVIFFVSMAVFLVYVSNIS